MTSRTRGFFRRLFLSLGFAVFSVLATLIVVELLAFAAWTVHGWIHPDLYPHQASSPAYQGNPWAAALWQEDSLRLNHHRSYVAFRVWGVDEWHGKYINTEKSELGIWRRTVNSVDQCEDWPKTNIWVFGGSAVFGTGVPDWATLPSYLSRQWNGSSPNCVVVHNFGVEGYVSTQELILLIEELRSGWRPDIVVFYDGFNDVAVARQTGDPRNGHFDFSIVESRIEGSLAGRLDFLRRTYAVRVTGAMLRYFFPRRSGLSLYEESQSTPTAVLKNYQANLEVARALSQVYHFKFYAFWQPTLLYGRKPRLPFEEQIVKVDANPDTGRVDGPAIAAGYQRAESEAQSGGNFVFYGGLFDSVPTPLYLDEVHTGPLGNEIAAQAIADYIKNH